MQVSEEMENLILEGGNTMDLEKQAQKEGILNLRQSGLEKVKMGITSIEELNRVTRD
jgi:type IV pilus assembly protein PilB